MDLLQVIKLVSIPKWVKFFSLAIIAVFIGLAIYAILGGAHLAEGAILQAGMGLLGVLLPLAIAIIFLTFYEAGVDPLKKATEKILTQLIPDIFSRLTTEEMQPGDKTHVVVEFIPEHTCRYRIVFPSKKELNVELQLNVRKLCAVFSFYTERAIDFPEVEKRLEHTLVGARHEGYVSNNVISHKKIGNRYCNSLVLYKSLPADFLWNSAEKLYFVQDMQVMIQSMIHEAGDWLTVKTTSES